jgi:hypothetical protein
LTQALGADEAEGFEDVILVFDPKFRVRRNSEHAFGDWVLANGTGDARAGELFFDQPDFGVVGGREEYFHA